MPRDAQGAHSLPAGTLVNTGDTVLVSQHNPAFQDVSQALTNSLDRDGKGGMRADLNLGGFRIQNAAPGSAPGDLATVAQATGSSIPVGSVIDYAGSVAPSGFVLCYGQALSRTTYAALFAAIGTAYGAGDGSTTFNVPDARGRTAAGKDNMGGTAASRLTQAVAGATLGATGGEEGHTLTIGEMPSHNHGVNDPAHDHVMPGSIVGSGGIGSGSGLGQGDRLSSTQFTGISIQNNGGGGVHNNTQPTIVFNKIIKTGGL